MCLLFFARKRRAKLLHAKNMILIAAADSEIKDEEMIIMHNILNRLNISHDTFKRALYELDRDSKISIKGDVLYLSRDVITSIEVVPVQDLKEKIRILLDYVMVMMSDGNINDKEIAICDAIAKKMGLPRTMVDACIRDIGRKTNGYGADYHRDPEDFEQ